MATAGGLTQFHGGDQAVPDAEADPGGHELHGAGPAEILVGDLHHRAEPVGREPRGSLIGGLADDLLRIEGQLRRAGFCHRHLPLHGALPILVNNAGATWGAPLQEFPASAWDKILNLNLKAPFFLTRALLPLLEAAGTHDDPARVINVGSIDGLHVPSLPVYSYAPSKA